MTGHFIAELAALQRAADRARDGDEVDRQILQIVGKGLDACRDVRLGRGGQTLAAFLRRRRRDNGYRLLAALVSPGRREGRAAARACLAEVRRYEGTSWPRDRAAGCCRRPADEVRRYCFDILDACSGAGVKPLGLRRLIDVLRDVEV